MAGEVAMEAVCDIYATTLEIDPPTLGNVDRVCVFLLCFSNLRLQCAQDSLFLL